MKLHWKIGGAMAVIAALVSAGGGVAAYRSTDSELNDNIDRSLLDSAERVVGRAFDRDHDEDDEDHDDEDGHHDDGAAAPRRARVTCARWRCCNPWTPRN